MCFYYGSLKWPSHLPAHGPLEANKSSALGSESDDPSAKKMATGSEELRVSDLRVHSKTNPASQLYSSLADGRGMMIVFPLIWKAYLSFLCMGGHFTCMHRRYYTPAWWMWRICLSVFKVWLLTLFDSILSKEPIWGEFCDLRSWSQPCKIKTGESESYGGRSHPHIVIVIMIYWYKKDIPHLAGCSCQDVKYWGQKPCPIYPLTPNFLNYLDLSCFIYYFKFSFCEFNFSIRRSKYFMLIFLGLKVVMFKEYRL